MVILDGCGAGFQGQRIHIHHIECLAAGGGFGNFPVEQHSFAKLCFQSLTACPEAPADDGRILDGAGDVHGEAHQGSAEFPDQLHLAAGTLFPDLQDLLQGYFHGGYLLSNGDALYFCHHIISAAELQ